MAWWSTAVVDGVVVVGGIVVGVTVVSVEAPPKEQATPLIRQLAGSCRLPVSAAT